MAMAKNRSTMARRAWRLLRLALLWAGKGGALKRSFLLGLRLHKKTLRGGRHPNKIGYLERQFSFDETPLFHFKMHRAASLRLPRIPCINPPTSFDDDDDDDVFFRQCPASPLLERVLIEESVVDESNENDSEILDDGEEEGGIDLRAEEFIARFYAEMKLQRQVSWHQYNEMLQRGAS